jgi:hypothetical protein
MPLLGIAILLGATTLIAAPPGPIDGQNIPSNFGASKLVATQLNVTGYGNQTVSYGGITVGSELDGLYLSKTGSELKLALAGNWNTTAGNNHAVIFIGTPNHTGQTELKAQGVGGPPFRVQELSQLYVLNTNGTPGNTADDTCDFSSNGVTLPCEADYAIGIDTFSPNVSISLYTLETTPVGTAECGAPGGPTYQTFASRQFVTQSALANTTGMATNPQGVGFDSVGMNNNNVDGVTSTDASGAGTAHTGLEMTIPFSSLNLTGSETITLNVLLTGGGSGGYISNQAFPNGPNCSTPGRRPNLAALGRTCMSVNLATLPSWSGGSNDSDGRINALHYGGATSASQSCPTDFGDQRPDPSAIVLTNGTELNAMYVSNDNDNIYVGITGNLPAAGTANGILLFVDTGPGGMGGLAPLSFAAGGRVNGMTGSYLPLDVGSNGQIDFIQEPVDDQAIDYDYAFETNFGGNPIVNVDRRNLIANSTTFYGRNRVNSNGEESYDGVTATIDFQVAYSYFNSTGVPRQDANGTGTDLLTQAQVAQLAATATHGLEFQIPLASIDLTAADLPRKMHIWALVVNNNGTNVSNQALPSIRDPSGTRAPADNYSTLAGGPHDFSADGPAAFSDITNLQKSSYARAATVLLTPPPPPPNCAAADVNCDGSVNGGDILSVRAPGTWNTASTGRADVNNDGQVNGGDILAVRAPGTWNTSSGPCTCGP